MSPHGCPTCDRLFETDHGVRVHHSKAHGWALPNRECAKCGSEYYSEHERKYCSEKCRSEAVSFKGTSNPNYRGGKSTTTCDLCGDSFEFYPSEKEGCYCHACVESESWQSPPSISGSKNPHWNGGKQTVQCDTCGSEMNRWPNEINGRTFCDGDCLSEWLSENFVGSDHPNWQETQEISYGSGWEQAREQALERDKHSCKICGVSRSDIGQNPDIHHITPVRWFVDSDLHARSDAHSLENLVSLCRACHRKAEGEEMPKSILQSLARGED